MRRLRLGLLALAVAPWPLGAALAAEVRQAEALGGWLLTGAMHEGRLEHAATLLADGRVLVCGGRQDGGPPTLLVPGCEVWSPETERWSAAGTLARPRVRLTGTRLADGRVAFFGGLGHVAPSPGDASHAVDVWDPRSNTTTAAGGLPFSTESPLVARQPDGRLLVIDGVPTLEKLRAAFWNPADQTTSPAEMPNDSGRPLSLSVDSQGIATLVLVRVGCREVAIWRRRAGAAWTLARVDAVSGCAGAGALALDDLQIAQWWGPSWRSATQVMLWNASSGAARTMEIANPIPFEQLLALDGGRLLELDAMSLQISPMRGLSYLYLGGKGWRFAGFIDHQQYDTFTPLADGRALTVGRAHARVWTPWSFASRDPCRGLIAQVEDALGRPWSTIDTPAADNVSPACRAEIAANPNAEASLALKELVRRPAENGGRAGMQALCAVSPPWGLEVMIHGLAPDASDDRGATCLAALADSDQLSARQAVDGYIQGCGHGDRPCDALPAAIRSSARAQLRAAEIYAMDRRADGAGATGLRNVVCEGSVPKPAAAACRKADEAQVPQWRRDQRTHAWLMTGAVTAIGVGLAIGGAATRNDDVGEGFAIAAATLGLGTLFAATMDDRGPMGGFADAFKGCLGVTGGVVGLVGAALVTGSTSSSGGPRAAISIAGGALFTLAALIPIWRF